MAVRFALFDRWGAQLRTLTDVASAVWTEELNGEDTLALKSAEPIEKGQRIVWCDGLGTWHEHTVASVEQSHDDDGLWYSAVCENSVSELYGDWHSDRRLQGATAQAALSAALEPTRWQVGTVSVPGTNSASFYRESAREALQKVLETWGGELSTTIAVSGSEVTARKVNIARRGADNGKRFAWGKDMVAVRRVFDADDVVTALYGFGKGVESGDGYGRGLDFASVNGGRMYVESTDARSVWGRPDGRGGKAHVFGKVEFSDCEDARELLRLTREELARRSEPRVSYEASVAVFAMYGYDFEDVGLGDDVALIDRDMEPEVRVKGRVTRVVRDLLDDGRATDITIGNIIEDAAGLMAAKFAELQSLASRSTAWDVAAYTPGAYIQQIMDGLNKEFDAGASYIYQSPEQGIIVGSVPLDPATGKPTRTPASAIQLKGGGFRIANKVRSNGEFDWRAFGTGDGFVADEIVAGVLRGGSSYWNLDSGDLLIKQGSIRSTDGKCSWNLSTGEFVTGGTVDGVRFSVTISPSKGFRVTADGAFVGGLEVVDGKAHIRAARCGSSASLYVTTGQTQAGNPGASFVNSYGNYCDIEALRAVDDTSGKTTGMGMSCFDWPWLHVSRYYKQVMMHPPTGAANDYLTLPGRMLSLSDTSALLRWSQDCYFGIGSDYMSMRWNSSRGLFIRNGETMLMHDATHYVRITGSRIEIRCGSKGGGFDSDGTWKDWVWY